jgi:MoxR-like ATPase
METNINRAVNPVEFGLCDRIIENISEVIVGKRQAIELLLVAFLADGHALIEDVPGVG